jgi:hypothetical protein
MKILGICGKKRSGKDTAGEYLIEKYGYVRYAFGDPVKDVCRVMFKFTEEQLYGDKKEVLDERWGISPREAFQKIGTDFCQHAIHKIIPDITGEVRTRHFWTKHFEIWLDEQVKINPDIKVVITDVRFKHEAKVIKKLGGSVLKILRNGVPKDDHISETELENVSASSIVENNGTLEDLYKKLDLEDSVPF